jgi:hypothetical protein
MPPADRDHPPDEQLSAIVDGEAAVPTHVASCAQCRDRIGQFSGVANAVRHGVDPLDPESVNRFVGLAVGGGRVVSLADRRRSPIARPAAFALAAVLLIVVGIPSVLWMTRARTTSGTIATLSAEAAKSKAARQSASTLAPGAGATGTDSAAALQDVGVAAPHLGAIDTTAALVERLRAEPTTRAAAATSRGGAAASSPPQPESPAYTSSCEASVRRASAAQLGAVDFVATLVWQGEDAEVVVFAPTGSATERDAVVSARSDCRELARQRF